MLTGKVFQVLIDKRCSKRDLVGVNRLIKLELCAQPIGTAKKIARQETTLRTDLAIGHARISEGEMTNQEGE